jgi:hypothetical protein
MLVDATDYWQGIQAQYVHMQWRFGAVLHHNAPWDGEG